MKLSVRLQPPKTDNTEKEKRSYRRCHPTSAIVSTSHAYINFSLFISSFVVLCSSPSGMPTIE